MCTGGESNQGPLGPKSDALSTAPLRPQKDVVMRIMKQFHVFRNSFIVIKAHIYKSLFNEGIKLCFEGKV